MATTAIIGASGYSGQETLDRVLAHPELELVALGSDSLAGEPAAALDPRLGDTALPAFTTNAEAAACGADVLFLCLDNDAAAAFVPPADYFRTFLLPPGLRATYNFKPHDKSLVLSFESRTSHSSHRTTLVLKLFTTFFAPRRHVHVSISPHAQS